MPEVASSPTIVLTRIIARSAGVPALQRIIPVYAGIGIMVAVLFGSNGLSASTITLVSGTSVGFRFGLWTAWILVAAGPARELLLAPSLSYLRSLPTRRLAIWGVLTGLLVALQLPWFWLWLRGAGPLEAAAATAAVSAVVAACAIRPRSLAERVAVVVAVAGIAVVIAVPIHAAGVLAAGAVGLVIAVPAAWSRAPERGWIVSGPRVRGSGVGALARLHAAALWRRRRPNIGRGIAITLLGAGISFLVARSNAIAGGESLAIVSLAVATFTLPAAVGAIAIPVFESEASARWLLASAGASTLLRVASTHCIVVGFGAVFGVAHGGLLAWGVGAGPDVAARVIGGAAVAGMAWGAILLRFSRSSERADGVDGTRVLWIGIGFVFVSIIGIGWLGEVTLVPLVALAIGLAIATETQAGPPRARRRRAGRR